MLLGSIFIFKILIASAIDSFTLDSDINDIGLLFFVSANDFNTFVHILLNSDRKPKPNSEK